MRLFTSRVMRRKDENTIVIVITREPRYLLTRKTGANSINTPPDPMRNTRQTLSSSECLKQCQKLFSVGDVESSSTTHEEAGGLGLSKSYSRFTLFVGWRQANDANTR